MGSNDLFGQETESPQFYCYVRSLVALIRIYNPDALIIFASIPPRLIYIKRLDQFVIHNKIRHFNNAMNVACEDSSVKYINIHKRMVTVDRHDQVMVLPDMLKPDGIQLGVAGRQLVVEVIQKELTIPKIQLHYNKMRMLRAAESRLKSSCPVRKQYIPLEQLIRDNKL